MNQTIVSNQTRRLVARLEILLVTSGVDLDYRRTHDKMPTAKYEYAYTVSYKRRKFTSTCGSNVKDEYPALGWIAWDLLMELEQEPYAQAHVVRVKDESYGDDFAAHVEAKLTEARKLQRCLGDDLYAKCADLIRSFQIRTDLSGHYGESREMTTRSFGNVKVPDNLVPEMFQ